MRKRSGRTLPLGGLRGFEATARRLSFKLAAEELHVTQSAMSRQIQGLEEALGARLFDRKTRALVLTETGRELYAVAHEVLARLDQAVRRIRERGDRRSITVTTFASVVSMWLLPRLPEFNQSHPDVDVRILAVDRVLDLEAEGIDLAIRGYAAPTAPGGVEELFREELFPVCSPAVVERVGRPLRTPADLAAYVLLDYVSYSGGPFGRWYGWARWLEEAGTGPVEAAGKLSFSYFDQIIQAAVRGQGVALGRSPLIADLLEAGDLIAPFRGPKVPGYNIGLATARGARERKEVQAFVAWLKGHAVETNVTLRRFFARSGRSRQPAGESIGRAASRR